MNLGYPVFSDVIWEGDVYQIYSSAYPLYELVKDGHHYYGVHHDQLEPKARPRVAGAPLPQRQGSLRDQMVIVSQLAIDAGCYDAADAINERFLR